MWVAVFKRRIEVAHYLTQHLQIVILMNNIEERGVIFVDKYHCLLPGFRMGALYESLQSLVGLNLVSGALAIYRLIACQFVAQFQFQLLFVAMLGCTHAKHQHWIFSPIFLHCFDEETLEQVLSSLKVCL